MRYRTDLAAAALALTSFTTAQATISLPTVTPVPIPAGTLITDGGGATLDSFVSQDLFANTSLDWTIAAIVVELTAGSIYQDTAGGAIGPASPIVIGAAPSVEFDTYLTNTAAFTAIEGAAGDLGDLVFKPDETTGLSVSWHGFADDQNNIGATGIGRFTFSDDAQGTWSLAVGEKFSTADKFVSNPIVNGQMIVDPLHGDLNFDGFVGIEDLNIVLGNWNQNPTPGDLPAGDISGDGFVGLEDLNSVLTNWNAGTPPRPTVPVFMGLPGDRNGDGFVGIDDKVNTNWNATVTPGDIIVGDMSGDGFVGIDDQNILISYWNTGTPPALGVTIPEPGALALLAVGCVALFRPRA